MTGLSIEGEEKNCHEITLPTKYEEIITLMPGFKSKILIYREPFRTMHSGLKLQTYKQQFDLQTIFRKQPPIY